MKGSLMLWHSCLQFTASVTDLNSESCSSFSAGFSQGTPAAFSCGDSMQNKSLNMFTHGHACTHTHAPTPTQKNCLNIHTHMISVSQHSSCAYLSLITLKAGVHLMVSEMK